MVDNMEWFNVFGLIFIAVIMIPNVVFAIKCKDGFDNKWNNKYVEVTEQVGRLGCFGFMIINIPGTWFGWWSDETFAVYLIVDTILVMLYCAIWIICFKKNSIFRALALSIIPSMLFLFSGIMSRSVLLIIASVLFAPSHIVISYKNVNDIYKFEFVKEIYNMKKVCLAVLPALTIVLELLPFGAVCIFATSPTERVKETFSYFSLTPFGYANFAPLITATLTVAIFLLSLFSLKKKGVLKALFVLSIITVVISLLPLMYGLNYYTLVGAFITVTLVIESILAKIQQK